MGIRNKLDRDLDIVQSEHLRGMTKEQLRAYEIVKKLDCVLKDKGSDDAISFLNRIPRRILETDVFLQTLIWSCPSALNVLPAEIKSNPELIKIAEQYKSNSTCIKEGSFLEGRINILPAVKSNKHEMKR